MKKGTKQLWVDSHIRRTGTTWIVGQASRLSPSSWHPLRGITKTSIPVWQRESHDTRTTCARSLTCFRHPVGRSILVRTLRAPDSRPRKRLITNECQPIPPYSGRGCPRSQFRLLTLDSGLRTSDLRPPTSAQSCPVVPGRSKIFKSKSLPPKFCSNPPPFTTV